MSDISGLDTLGDDLTLVLLTYLSGKELGAFGFCSKARHGRVFEEGRDVWQRCRRLECWAEPDLDDAVDWMRKLRQDGGLASQMGARAAASIARSNSAETIGRIIATTLATTDGSRQRQTISTTASANPFSPAA